MTSVDLKIKKKSDFDKPKKYAVVFYNDEYTEMAFVTRLLRQHYGHDYQTAHGLMLQVHNEGKAVAGIYPYDIAEHKACLCMDEAKANGQPLVVLPEDA